MPSANRFYGAKLNIGYALRSVRVILLGGTIRVMEQFEVGDFFVSPAGSPWLSESRKVTHRTRVEGTPPFLLPRGIQSFLA
jgi:hypothetical protein